MAKLIDGIDFNIIENDAVVYESKSLQSFGYGIISRYVTTMKDLSLQAKGVYAYLIAFAGSDKQTYPSQSRMCSDLGIKKVDTLRKYIKELQLKGLIKIYKTTKNNIHYKNVYVIADDIRTLEHWKNEYAEDEGIKNIKIKEDKPVRKKEKPKIDENNNMIFEETDQDNNKNNEFTMNELKNTPDYNNIVKLKNETSELFRKSANTTKDLIIAQELRKLGYKIKF